MNLNVFNFSFWLFFVFVFKSLFALTAENIETSHCSSNIFHVVIDPGHGGVDTGTSRDSFVESKIVYEISEKVKEQLILSDSQHVCQTLKITMTREKDQGISLQNRAQLANDLKADLFVSLHANSSSSQRVNGLEFYFNSAQSVLNKIDKSKNNFEKALPNSNEIIAKIKKDLISFGKVKKSLEFTQQTQKQAANKKSVIRRAPFYVIENTEMPAVLIEVGFITNRREAKKLATAEYQTELASLLTHAILEYKEKSDKNNSVTEN